ncbi:acyl-CoA thioester hydrolase, YbgC/YbaW family [Mesobacillus persicus]|uniref:Acyl-CoA thioester hydrolase, YbgC/YbaW family n=1 Tax=Mesobacillus persicus TaxID=930146 RepID=A0A1H8EMI1_9BACI|nr:thioesterase family protein [Mesobacillus persicus]SEN20606.1 acyl-CoA thioester hydrolase, YbgC/YbaW family [Mesobacillus persicus]
MAYTEMRIAAETKTAHVNNVSLFEYLDEARKKWYHYSILNGVESVVVHIGINYKREVFNQNKLVVRTTLARVGNTSYTLNQTIVNHLEELVVSAEVVLTTINRQTRTKVKVPQGIRSLLDRDSLIDFDKMVAKGNSAEIESGKN